MSAERIEMLEFALRRVHDLSLLPFSDDKRREIGLVCRLALQPRPSLEELLSGTEFVAFITDHPAVAAGDAAALNTEETSA